MNAAGYIEAPRRVGVELVLGHRDQVVARDHTGGRQSLFKSDLDFGSDTADRSGDRRARDRIENLDGGVAGNDAHRATPRWRAEVCPDDVTASYHSGVVRAARRAAASTMAGS